MGKTEAVKPTIVTSGPINSSLTGTVMIILRYLITDMKKKPRSFKIGVFSIFLVVGFVSLMQSVIQLSSVVFLKIAEGQTGDADLILTPTAAENDTRLQDSSFTNNPLNSLRLLNANNISGVCSKMEKVVGCTPRWILFGDVVSQEKPNLKVRSYLLAMDTAKENSIGLGRGISLKKLKEGEAYLTYSTARSIDLDLSRKNPKVNLKIDILKTLVTQGTIYLNTNSATSSGSDNVISNNSTITDGREDSGKNSTMDEQIEKTRKDLQFLISSELKKLVERLPYQDNLIFNSTTVKNEIKTLRKNTDLSGISLSRENKNIIKNITKIFGIPDSETERYLDNPNDLKNILDAINDLPDNRIINVSSVIDELAPVIVNALNMTFNLSVSEVIKKPNGKWGDFLGNVIAIDSKYLIKAVLNSITKTLEDYSDNTESVSTDLRTFLDIILSQTVKQSILDQISTVDINDYAMTENFVFKNRLNIYTDSANIKRNIIRITNDFYKKIGKSHPSKPAAALPGALQALFIMKNFLDNIFAVAVFLLILLSILLIYSLMLSNVEEKTYEFGMLRALGLKTNSLMILLVLQGLFFAIPGLGIGLLFSGILNMFVASVIFSYSDEAGPFELHYSAITIGVLLGFLMPLISNILPISRALSKTLRDSLNVYQRAINEILVKVMKLESLGISFSQFVTSYTLIVMGVVCYYFAPAAFIYQNISLFLAILNIVLILMILGITMLLNIMQDFLQIVVLKITLCFFRGDRPLESVIRKNMQAHKKRNSKTAIMFSIALAFLIFAGTGFKLQVTIIESMLKTNIGTDLTAEVLRSEKIGLKEYELRNYLDNYRKKYPDNIQSYAFVSFTVDRIPGMDKPKISTLCMFPTKGTELKGVEPHFLETLNLKYYMPTEYDESIPTPELPTGQKDGIKMLFAPEANVTKNGERDPFGILSTDGAWSEDTEFENTKEKIINLAIPEGVRTALSMDISTPAMIFTDQKRFQAKIRHMAAKIPGFYFSSYQQVTFFLSVIASMQDVAYMVNKTVNTSPDRKAKYNDYLETLPKNLTYNLPKEKLYIKFKRPLNEDERMELSNGMRNYFTNDMTFIFDVASLVETTQTAFFFIDLFFIMVSLISITISFFLILVSFVSNVKENSWEFGVLRAIGLNKFQMTRIYIFEATSLTTASAILGSLVGIIVAITLILQFLLFTELPFEFVFPTEIFCITFIFGICTSGFASYYALRQIREKSISSITKGLI